MNKLLFLSTTFLALLLLIRADMLGFIIIIIFLLLYVSVARFYEVKQYYKLIYLLVIFINSLAFVFNLYIVEWFDDFAHITNSFAITLFLAPIFYNKINISKFSTFQSLAVLFTFGLAIGVFWEFWEYYAGIYVFEELKPTYEDTISDLIFDSLGALAAGLLILNDES